MVNGAKYEITLEVNGFVLYQDTYTATVAQTNVLPTIKKGLNVASTVANAVITIKY